MTTTTLPLIKGFIETSFLDWPGQICAVVFLPYCNLRCPYCHNHRLVLKPDTLETLSLNRILERLTALGRWIDGLCITGGEPTIHHGLPLLLSIPDERRVAEAYSRGQLAVEAVPEWRRKFEKIAAEATTCKS